MLQVYKFLSDGNPLSSCNYLKVQSNSRVLGDCKKLVKGFARLDIRKFSFSHRVVNEWNGIVCLSGFLTQLLCTILKLTQTRSSVTVVEPNCHWAGQVLVGFLLFCRGFGFIFRASYGAFALLCPLTCYVMLNKQAKERKEKKGRNVPQTINIQKIHPKMHKAESIRYTHRTTGDER